MLNHDELSLNHQADEYLYAQIERLEEIRSYLNPFGIIQCSYNKIVGNNKYMAIYPQFPTVRKKYGYGLDFDHLIFPQLKMLETTQELSLWQCFTPDNQVVNELRNHGIGQGITLFIRGQDDVHETFHFAAALDNTKILDFYLNNVNILKSFSRLFLEKMGDLLDHRVPGRLIQAKQDFHVSKVAFTKREKMCLPYLKQGYSNKQIARFLNLSPRTIESHASNIIQKLGMSSRYDLLP